MKHIKELMKSGAIKAAAAELEKRLAAEPDNAEAKMLYGTCCHILGDDKTFCAIHDELAQKMADEKDEKTLSLWRKYRAIWLALIGTGLIFAGGAYFVGRDIVNMFGAATVNEPAHWGRNPLSLYRGPPWVDDRGRPNVRCSSVNSCQTTTFCGNSAPGPAIRRIVRMWCGCSWSAEETL